MLFDGVLYDQFVVFFGIDDVYECCGYDVGCVVSGDFEDFVIVCVDYWCDQYVQCCCGVCVLQGLFVMYCVLLCDFCCGCEGVSDIEVFCCEMICGWVDE